MFRKIIGLCFIIFISCQTNNNLKNEVLDLESAVKEAVTIAILDFKILSNDSEVQGFGQEIPQNFSKEFINNPDLKPVERQDLEAAVDELKLSLVNLSDDTALKIGKFLGARYILLGSLVKVKNLIKINCRVIETETGEIIFSDSEKGNMKNIFEIEETLAKTANEKISSLISSI